MKKSYWSVTILSLVILFSSCKKKDDTPVGNFNVKGLADITIDPIKSMYGYLSFSLYYTGSTEEQIQLSLEGLPKSCHADFSKPYGFPEFSPILTISDTSAVAGTYPMKLVCDGDKTGRKTFNFNLVIKPGINYAARYLGTYATVSASANSSHTGYYTINITENDGSGNIDIYNFDNTAKPFHAVVTNNGQTIVIPEQTVNGATYYSNSFKQDGNFYEFYFTKIISGDTTNCGVTFIK